MCVCIYIYIYMTHICALSGCPEAIANPERPYAQRGTGHSSPGGERKPGGMPRASRRADASKYEANI